MCLVWNCGGFNIQVSVAIQMARTQPGECRTLHCSCYGTYGLMSKIGTQIALITQISKDRNKASMVRNQNIEDEK